MLIMIISIMILIAGLLNIDKINSKFNKPTIEELESYQEAVFLHMDEEITKYKKELSMYYNEKGKPLVNEMQGLIEELDFKIKEYKEVEKRLDEKITKLDEFKKLLG